MLNLDDLNSGHDASFFAVNSMKRKSHSYYADETISPHHGPILGDSQISLASSEGYSGGRAIGRDLRLRPTPSTTAFVILGGDTAHHQNNTSQYPATSKQGNHALRAKSSLSTASRVDWIVALVIFLCLVFHAVGLLVFFTPWYNQSIQVWIFRRFYSSFSSASGFQSDVDAKRSAVACVYLLFVGVTPTALAGSLWFTFSSHRRLRCILTAPSSLLRHKPVFFSSWRPLYIDMSTGELLMITLLFAANAFLFIHVLLRAKTNVWSTPSDKIWRDLSRAFAFNAVFSLVWLLLLVLKPSSWSLYLDIVGISSPHITAKYRKWLSGVVMVCSSLHAICMAIHFALRGELKSRLIPARSEIVSDPVVGLAFAGEIALGTMLIGWIIVVPLRYRLHPSFLIFMRRASAVVAVGALCVHYPVAIAWLLPSLTLLLVQRVVAWSHSRYPVELLDVAPLPYGVTRIVVRRHTVEMDMGGRSGGGDGGDFTPGQYVYINLPKVSWLQWRRCTIASSPARHPGELTLYVKEEDESHSTPAFRSSWSRRVHDVAKMAYAGKKAPVLYVDGFYGPTHSMVYDKYRCLVFVAEGTGIVELLSMLEQLYHEAWLGKSEELEQKAAVAHVGGCLTGEDDDTLDVPERRRSDGRQVWLLWTNDDVCLFKEFEELFFRIRALDPDEEIFRLRFFLTRIPTHDDLRYQRLAACAFPNGDVTESKRATGALPAEVVRFQNPCRRVSRSKRPQNRSALCCWPSRPFQQALGGAGIKMLTLWLVLLADVLLAIVGEWRTLTLQAKDEFRPVKRLHNASLGLGAAAIVALVVALLHDAIQSIRRKYQPQLQHHTMAPNQLAPMRGLTKLQSMNKLVDHTEDEEPNDLEHGAHDQSNSGCRDSGLEPAEIGPDVIERLQIYSMRPDVDKFLQSVARAFPRFAGRVGVFASGNQQLIDQVETATLASNAATGEWREANAAFDFHCIS